MGEKVNNTWNNEELLKKYHETGDIKIRNKVITKNQGFVKLVVRKYYQSGNHLDFEDLVNEGNIGLIDAAERFEYGKGYKFISYAAWWIKQAILGAMNKKEKVIRVPLFRKEEIVRLDKIIIEYIAKYNRKPTDRELSVYLRKSLDYLNELLSYPPKVISLDSVLNSEDEDKTKESIVADEYSEIPYENIENSMLVDKILEITELSKKEEEILKMRYGIGKGYKRTLREIGEHYNLTKERIRQILNKSENKIIMKLGEKEYNMTKKANKEYSNL